MDCDKIIFGICFIEQSYSTGSSIFGFGDFISALALLVIVYTVVDIRYQFRVAIAPFPLFIYTYFLIGFIGFGTLITDIWDSEDWLVPASLINQPIWEGILGGLFLLLALTWIYYAFINPPIYNDKNYKKYSKYLYRAILKGSDDTLPVIADELGRSAEELIRYSYTIQQRSHIYHENKNIEPNASNYAFEMLLLIGNRKFCRHVINSAPGTAIYIFESMTKNDKYDLPIGQFSSNITKEAILNNDSILYHEDHGYKSGLLGYIKPFSQAIYGNYDLVEQLGKDINSPLDLGYEEKILNSPNNLKVYSRIVKITFSDYLKKNNTRTRSTSLNRALSAIKDNCRGLYLLNNNPDYYSTEQYERLFIVMSFFKDLIELINESPPLPAKLRSRDDNIRHYDDFYDHITNHLFEIIFMASSVKSDRDVSWNIQHNTVWGEIFDIYNGKAWDIIRFKLRRMLYDEILRLEKTPNFKSSKILGLCLNVMGLKIGNKKEHGKEVYALRKVIINWTKSNYLRLRKEYPEIADSVITGFLSYDEKNNRIVKTYNSMYGKEGERVYLDLVSPN